MNDYPQEYDVEGAIEIRHGFVTVAWTESDAVYLRKPWAPSSEREDGYEYIGTLEWETHDFEASYAEVEAHNTARLDTFVQEYKNRVRRETGESFVPPEVAAREGVK